MAAYSSGHSPGQNRWQEIDSVWPKISNAHRSSPQCRFIEASVAGGSAAQPYTITVRLRASRSGRAVSTASSARTMAGELAHSAVTPSASIISAM